MAKTQLRVDCGKAILALLNLGGNYRTVLMGVKASGDEEEESLEKQTKDTAVY